MGKRIFENYTIRVKTRSEADEPRTVTVSKRGCHVHCSCPGFTDEETGGFCSHIDAVLLNGERAMVYPDDHTNADLAAKAAFGMITTPPNWKGSWRRNLRWRGLTYCGLNAHRARDPGLPIVCFTGKLYAERKSLLAEARENGWETIDSPSAKTHVLVAEDPTAASAKLKKARAYGTPILSGGEWQSLLSKAL